jgi:hypothetical protein
LIYKFASMFYRAGASSQQYRQSAGGNPNRPANSTKRPSGNVKGGEYVDYEEVK